MSRDYDSFVYMVTNFYGTVLYTGVTSDLCRRVWEHKHGVGSKFTKEYHVDRLVFFEHYYEVRDAIAHEKQIKGWTRAKKETFIRTMNFMREDITYMLEPNWQRPPTQKPPETPKGSSLPSVQSTLEGPSTSLRMTK